MIKFLIVVAVTAVAAAKPAIAYFNYFMALRSWDIRRNRAYGSDFSEEAPVAPKVWKGAVATAVAFFASVFLVNSFAVVPGGHRGVVFSQTSGVEERVLPEGMSFVLPVVETVHTMDVRTSTVTFRLDQKNPAASKDGQDVYMVVTVSYNPSPEKVNKLWQEVGDREAFEQKVLGREVLQVTKAEIPAYQAQDIFSQREAIRGATMKGLNERATVNKYITVTSVSIENVDFKKEFRELLEQKAQRTQALEIAKKDVEIAEQAKLKKIKESEGTMTSTKNIADGQAYKNRVLATTVTNKSLGARQLDILEIYANKYGGGVPTTYINLGGTSGGSSMLPVLSIDQLMQYAQQNAAK